MLPRFYPTNPFIQSVGSCNCGILQVEWIFVQNIRQNLKLIFYGKPKIVWQLITFSFIFLFLNVGEMCLRLTCFEFSIKNSKSKKTRLKLITFIKFPEKNPIIEVETKLDFVKIIFKKYYNTKNKIFFFVSQFLDW